MNIDIKWVFDIIDSHIDAYEKEENNYIGDAKQHYESMNTALFKLKQTLYSFIEEANKL